jgi:imidazolonepropionase
VADPLGVIEDGAVVWDERGVLTYVGPRTGAPAGVALEAAPGVITPGLVDAHTHAAWVGSRHLEYAVRLSGGDYRDIANAGGGIVSSHHAIEGATQADIARVLAARLARMARLGVTCVEVKSGYGLLPELELRQLRAIEAVAARADAPRVVPTYLALHALPPWFQDRRSAFVEGALALVDEIATAKLARFVDAYVDAHAFTVDEARALGVAAKNAGLGVRLHVGQFADVGGAELAGELGASSADHLEHVGADGIAALAAAGTAAVLLPVASFTLGQAPPPIAALRRAGVSLVVASDANPGTAPTESLPLAMALGVRSYGLTPAEALLGATREAARSLLAASGAMSAANHDAPTGMLREGDPADMVAWDLPHEIAIIQPWGVARTWRVLREGAELFARAPLAD